MEDDKLAAYYDDLTRRGAAAARFKQGLGFSSDAVPSRGAATTSSSSSSSLLSSSFVRASSPSKTEKQAQLHSIQNKLTTKPKQKTLSRSSVPDSSRSPSRDRIRDKHSIRRSRSRSRSPDKYSSRRSRSRSRDRVRGRHSSRRSRSRDKYSRRRSRSRDRQSRRRSREDESRRKYRSRSRSRETSQRQRSPPPEGDRRSEKGKRPGEACGSGGLDFAKLIQGYDAMTPAERVKAKMKLQLSTAAENDKTIGKGSGWERFEFNQDAPLDDEEELEAAEDDAALVKNMGQSFRFSAVQARKEEETRTAHDEAMFGVSSYPPPAVSDDEAEEGSPKQNVDVPVTSLLSDQVLTMQKGSWRDRLRKP